MVFGAVLVALIVGYAVAVLLFALGSAFWSALGIGWLVGMAVLLLLVASRLWLQRRAARNSDRPTAEAEPELAADSGH